MAKLQQTLPRMRQGLRIRKKEGRGKNDYFANICASSWVTRRYVSMSATVWQCSGETRIAPVRPTASTMPLGIHAGVDALKGRDAALLVLLDAAGHVQPVDAHGNDQVAVREILGVDIHVHAGDVAQAGHVLRALEHGV